MDAYLRTLAQTRYGNFSIISQRIFFSIVCREILITETPSTKFTIQLFAQLEPSSRHPFIAEITILRNPSHTRRIREPRKKRTNQRKRKKSSYYVCFSKWTGNKIIQFGDSRNTYRFMAFMKYDNCSEDVFRTFQLFFRPFGFIFIRLLFPILESVFGASALKFYYRICTCWATLRLYMRTIFLKKPAPTSSTLSIKSTIRTFKR